MNKVKWLKVVIGFVFFSIFILSGQQVLAEVNTKILGTYKSKTGEVKIERSNVADYPYKVTIETVTGA